MSWFGLREGRRYVSENPELCEYVEEIISAFIDTWRDVAVSMGAVSGLLGEVADILERFGYSDEAEALLDFAVTERRRGRYTGVLREFAAVLHNGGEGAIGFGRVAQWCGRNSLADELSRIAFRKAVEGTADVLEGVEGVLRRAIGEIERVASEAVQHSVVVDTIGSLAIEVANLYNDDFVRTFGRPLANASDIRRGASRAAQAIREASYELISVAEVIAGLLEGLGG